MRNQFFLDARDYTKFALLQDLMGVPGLEQLTIVWLLTPDQPNGHGRRIPVLDPERRDLNCFFKRDPRPELFEVSEYYSTLGIPCNSYGHGNEMTFTRESRAGYLDRIPSAQLRSALVFFDPDNGMEPSGGFTSAHLRYGELLTVWAKMDATSIALIYQHRPRVKAEIFWPRIASRLAESLGAAVGWFPTSDVAFFVAASDTARLTEVKETALSGPTPFVEWGA